MQLSENLRARISALGELSRPLGDIRARSLGRDLIDAVARDVARGQDPQATIDAWIRRIAAEITGSAPKASAAAAEKPRRARSLADILPEVH